LRNSSNANTPGSSIYLIFCIKYIFSQLGVNAVQSVTVRRTTIYISGGQTFQTRDHKQVFYKTEGQMSFKRNMSKSLQNTTGVTSRHKMRCPDEPSYL